MYAVGFFEFSSYWESTVYEFPKFSAEVEVKSFKNTGIIDVSLFSSSIVVKEAYSKKCRTSSKSPFSFHQR